MTFERIATDHKENLCQQIREKESSQSGQRKASFAQSKPNSQTEQIKNSHSQTT